MKALYALPDHEVVMELIPRIADTHLSADAAVERIRAVNGLVPVAIDPESETGGGGKVLWADIGDHLFQEWQFMYTVQTLAQRGQIGEAFTTDFSILLDDRILADPIYPSGLIFHVSRCGSTLTAKAIARSPRHVVLNQAGPLQRGFWATITNDWEGEAKPTPENLKAFRNLVLAMARRRRPDQRYSFVKFISWNTLYLDFISKAFPEVPAVFLYRNAVEVIASVLRETTAILWAKGRPQAGFLTGLPWRETIDMDVKRYLAICFAEYFRVALNAGGRVSHINYTSISPESFPVILRQGLHFEPGDGEFELMVEQFRFHSKDDGDKTVFTSDSAEKQSAISAEDKAMIDRECAALMQQLDRSPDNLFVQSSG
jgi:hypothetical protein